MSVPLGVLLPIALVAVAVLVLVAGAAVVDAIYTGGSWLRSLWRVVVRFVRRVLRGWR